MRKLKALDAKAIPAALVKARQYRLLGEPDETGSICMDVLAVQPDHQEALITLLLAHTDKFAAAGLQPSFDQAMAIAARLQAPVHRSYYTGLIYERRAKFHFRQGGAEADATAYAWFTKAMAQYDQALAVGVTDNQDAALRWNSCARFIDSRSELKSYDVE